MIPGVRKPAENRDTFLFFITEVNGIIPAVTNCKGYLVLQIQVHGKSLSELLNFATFERELRTYNQRTVFSLWLDISTEGRCKVTNAQKIKHSTGEPVTISGARLHLPLCTYPHHHHHRHRISFREIISTQRKICAGKTETRAAKQ